MALMMRSKKLTNEKYVDIINRMSAEEEECTGVCKEATDFKPHHFSCFASITYQGIFYIANNGCESGGRLYNQETDEFEGRPHCTCDTCW